MKKILKRLVIVFLTIIGMLLIGLIIFINTLNPNQYKPQIVSAIYNTSGYTASLEGDIKLGFYPSLTLDIEHAKLNQKNIQLAELPHLYIQLAIKPLLEKKVIIKSIKLKKPSLFFTIDANNKSNWIVQPKNHTAKINRATGNIQESKLHSVEALTLNSFIIQDARIYIKQANQVLKLHPLNFQANDININQPIKYLLSTTLQAKTLDSKIKAHLKLKGRLQLSLQKLKQNQFTESISTQATLIVKNFSFNHVHFEKMLSQIIHKEGLTQFKINELSAYNGLVSGSLLFHQSKKHLSSQIVMKNIDVGDLIYDINRVKILDGILTSSVNLTSYGQTSQNYLENLNGDMNIKVEQGKLLTIDIDGLMQSVTNIFSKKSSLEQYLLSSLKQLGQQENFNKNPTPFEFMTAKVDIKQGVAQANALKMTTNTLELQGQGSVSLIPQTLNINLNISMIEPTALIKNTLSILDNKIPLTITGPLQQPITRPNTNAILSSVKKHLIKKHQNKLNDTVKQITNQLPDLNKLF